MYWINMLTYASEHIRVDDKIDPIQGHLAMQEHPPQLQQSCYQPMNNYLIDEPNDGVPN